MRGRPWLYYIYGPREVHAFPLRHDLFGFSNYTGLCSALLLLLLLATSNDNSLRVLGTPRWKQLQRWNYFAFAFGVLMPSGIRPLRSSPSPEDVRRTPDHPAPLIRILPPLIRLSGHNPSHERAKFEGIGFPTAGEVPARKIESDLKRRKLSGRALVWG